MIDLLRSPSASPLVHAVDADPGASWTKDAAFAVDAPPDGETEPAPEARWPAGAPRTGVCGAVSPRVVRLAGGGYRLYYTQILPRPGFPAGANDYKTASTRILSAASPDGDRWTPEPGVRLAPKGVEAGELRVVSSEVVPAAGGDGRFRMYYESCPGREGQPSVIHSALSEDGLAWVREPGARLAGARSLIAVRIVFLDGGGCRLYCCEAGAGIISAVSEDGLTFRREPGVRVAPGASHDALTAFAPEIVRLPHGGYVMYYAGYSAPNRAYVLRAESADGLTWRKSTAPVVSPGGRWDRAKCSEMSILRLPERAGGAARYRMVYEACDGTAVNERGVWRVASATSAS